MFARQNESMPEKWLPLNNVPASGQNIVVDDPLVWSVPLAEFGMACRVIEPLRGEVLLLPLDGGCLVRGRLTGKAALPCDRCAEDVSVDIDSRFETFEPFPSDPALGEEDAPAADIDDAVARLGTTGPEINLGALLWEEFLLALPSKPLCSADCKGLCPNCGKNRNTQACSCPPEEGDPRLAALRNLKTFRQ